MPTTRNHRDRNRVRVRVGARTLALAALAAVVALTAAACSDDAALAIRALDPPYGPLVGGTLTTIHGRGFEAIPGTPPTVLVGGRAAPVVITVADDELTVLTPPGAMPGDVDVRVVVGERAAGATAGFRYSAPPTITSATPRDVSYEIGTLRVHVRGSGFLDEGAGPPTLLVDGQPIAVDVESDRELSFVSPGGWPLREPTLELVNLRGDAVYERAFRYVPGTRPGLLLFADDGLFATYLDPTDLHTVPIPRLPNGFLRLTSVVRDAGGAYWAVDRSRRVGRLDLSEQRLDAAVFPGRWFPTIERVADGYVAFDAGTRRLGRLDLPSGGFQPLSTWQPPFRGSFGLAWDGATLWFSYYVEGGDGGFGGGTIALRSVDPTTGDVGEPVVVDGPPDLHIEEMRFFAGKLYASSRTGGLFTIDPATGAVTEVPILLSNAHAIAIYE